MELLSRIVLTSADTTYALNELRKKVEPHLHATRGDYMEVIHQIAVRNYPERDQYNVEEDTFYLVIYTGNLLGMIEDLDAADLL